MSWHHKQRIPLTRAITKHKKGKKRALQKVFLECSSVKGTAVHGDLILLLSAFKVLRVTGEPEIAVAADQRRHREFLSNRRWKRMDIRWRMEMCLRCADKSIPDTPAMFTGRFSSSSRASDETWSTGSSLRSCNAIDCYRLERNG